MAYESHKREFEDIYNRDEVDAQDVSSMGRQVFQQNIVTSGKPTYADMDGNVAISELMPARATMDKLQLLLCLQGRHMRGQEYRMQVHS